MAQIAFELLEFVMKAYDLDKNESDTINFIIANQAYVRLSEPYNYYCCYYYYDFNNNNNNNSILINITDENVNDILIVYYGNIVKNKTIDDIKNDLIIKSLLE